MGSSRPVRLLLNFPSAALWGWKDGVALVLFHTDTNVAIWGWKDGLALDFLSY